MRRIFIRTPPFVHILPLEQHIVDANNCVSSSSSVYQSISIRRAYTYPLASSMPRYLSQSEAIALDAELMRKSTRQRFTQSVPYTGTCSVPVGELTDENDGVGYSLEQLMELAGLACAQAIFHHIKELESHLVEGHSKIQVQNILVVCGPGNNGGDGIVAARYLRLFRPNAKVTVWIPKVGKNAFFDQLLSTARLSGVTIVHQLLSAEESSDLQEAMSREISKFDYIVDAIFGFSFKAGEVREPYRSIIHGINKVEATTGRTLPIASIDIPSGWDVEQGKPSSHSGKSLSSSSPTNAEASETNDFLSPTVVISLTCPKAFVAKGLTQHGITHHYLGGRFIPTEIEKKYDLRVSELYKDSELIILLPLF